MIKAEYIGVDDDPLQSGKIYKISTRCVRGRLEVAVKHGIKSYPSLEKFLKEWKVKAVYHD